MLDVVFLPSALQELKKLKRQKQTEYIKQIWTLIEDIRLNGNMKGIGSPERLYFNKKYFGWYSRKIEINSKDTFNRLVYNATHDEIFVKECTGHYGTSVENK